MECPNCDGSIQPDNRQCPHCGADLVPQRVVLGKKEDEFSLTPEDENFELGDYAASDVWRFHREPVIDLVEQAETEASPGSDLVEQAESNPFLESGRVEWGGFMRRAAAFVVDCGVVLFLEFVMFTLAYIGYKVGLAAHGKVIRWENAISLLVWLMWGGIGLSAAYFVVFHGIDGQTIGKRMLGLRVVGRQQKAVTFTQASVRWLAMAGLAPLGLGFLWVLWSRERRTWHDLLARTWVIRESSESQMFR